ncbi:MAG TPA: hypothetical protein VFZ83_07675, partial [Acidimicrobiia bacterium]|nr:hypothetical protein [Acidimicrobiia bacterium]
MTVAPSTSVPSSLAPITPPTGAVDVPFRRLSERLQSGHPTVGVVGLGYVGLPLLVHAAGHGC